MSDSIPSNNRLPRLRDMFPTHEAAIEEIGRLERNMDMVASAALNAPAEFRAEIKRLRGVLEHIVARYDGFTSAKEMMQWARKGLAEATPSETNGCSPKTDVACTCWFMGPGPGDVRPDHDSDCPVRRRRDQNGYGNETKDHT